MKKVLFICTGNTCRSPMAQAVFNTLCAHKNLDMISRSAGLYTVTGIPPAANSRKVLAEQGIDLSDFTATSIEDKNIDDFDVFAVMTDDHKLMLTSFGVPEEKIYILAERTGGISDPYGGSEDRYRQCLQEIKVAVEELISKLCEEL